MRVSLHFVCVAALLTATMACTTVIVGRKASADGSTLCSHSNDAIGTTDGRLFRVPAADHPEGSMRPVYPSIGAFPRYVGDSRGEGNYAPTPEFPNFTQPIGYIPQVNHTYAIYEATYGVMNEHGLGMGETTCSGVFGSKPLGTPGGTALLSIDELSRIALERCTCARDAVQVMGQLAEEFGFYGPDSFEGTGETLMVVDSVDAFIFHILPDPTGKSAIWVARRVEDDHVAVVANMFVVREVDLNNTDMFYGAASMFDIAEQHSLWDPAKGPFDFTGAFSDGEYAHKYYTGRRMWGAYRLLTPDTKLSATYGNLKDDKPYPVTIPVGNKKVSVRDVMAVMRDWYADTPYDMTKGIAAGPWGTPNRYSGGPMGGEGAVNGSWERSITLFRTTQSSIVQSMPGGPDEVKATLWFGPHAAHGTVYMPLPAGLLDVPPAYKVGWEARLDRNSAYWAHRYVENLANLKFKYMIGDVQAGQKSLEDEAEVLQQRALDLWGKGGYDAKRLTEDFFQHADALMSTWWALADELMVKYADGWMTPDVKHIGEPVGYPKWWLEKVGYENGPGPVTADD